MMRIQAIFLNVYVWDIQLQKLNGWNYAYLVCYYRYVFIYENFSTFAMGCSATHCITFLRCNSFSIGGNLSHCTTSVLIFTVIPDILKFSTHIEHIICNWRLISAFRPSTIALSVVSLLLEGSRRNWVHSSHHLLKSLNVCAFPMVNFFFQIDISELVRCREHISSFWHPSLLPRFSSYGVLSSEDEDHIPPIPMDTTSPRCSFSTPSVTPHSTADLTSPQPQPTSC